MSHIVSLQTKLRDAAAITAACTRLGLPAPTQSTAKLYSGTATGLLVQLPDWNFPIVIDTQSGTVSMDNFGGRWGKQAEFDRFLQAYAVELTKTQARKKGYQVNETALQDGSIKLNIVEGAA